MISYILISKSIKLKKKLNLIWECEREKERERETSICCSTYLCPDWGSNPPPRRACGAMLPKPAFLLKKAFYILNEIKPLSSTQVFTYFFSTFLQDAAEISLWWETPATASQHQVVCAFIVSWVYELPFQMRLWTSASWLRFASFINDTVHNAEVGTKETSKCFFH